MLIYDIQEITSIYIDAIVANDDGHLLFLSAWGLDTATQEFLAKLTISHHEGGLQKFKVCGHGHSQWYRAMNAGDLVKHTGRTKNSLFGDLVHLWLHDRLATEIDYANRRCLLLSQHDSDAKTFSQHLWQAVQTVCPVPLLPEWQPVIREFEALGWIKKYKGISVDAHQLDFSSNDVEEQITRLIKIGLLKLPKKANHLSLVH